MANRSALDQKVAGLDAEIAEMERVQRFVAKHGAKAADAAGTEIARLKDIRGYLARTDEAKPATTRTRKPKPANPRGLTPIPDPADESTRMAV